MIQLYKNFRWQLRESRTQRITVVLIGLDGAGKTTICNSLGGQSDRNVMPTVGFNKPVELRLDGFEVKIMDIGGVRSFRPQWTARLARAHACIFVVDCANVDRLIEACDELGKNTGHLQFKGKPVLILANKQDVPGALDEIQLSQALGLDQGALAYCSNNIVKCVASKQHNNNVVDPAMKMGLHWLITAISASWSTINSRVISDCTALDKEEARRRAETSRIVAQRKRERREKQAADEMIEKGKVAVTNKPVASEGVGNVKRNSIVPQSKIGELSSSQNPADGATAASAATRHGSVSGGSKKTASVRPKVKQTIICQNMLLQVNKLVACENEASIRNMVTGWMPFCNKCHEAALKRSGLPSAKTDQSTNNDTSANANADSESKNNSKETERTAKRDGRNHIINEKVNNLATQSNAVLSNESGAMAGSNSSTISNRKALPPITFPQPGARPSSPQQASTNALLVDGASIPVFSVPDEAAKMAEEPQVGDRVNALFHGKTMWFTGKVTRQTWDPEAGLWTYDVRYDDGDEEEGVKRENICCVDASSLRKGHKVLAKYRGKGQVYGAVVVGVNERDNTYALTYDDGEEEGNAKRYWLKRVRKNKQSKNKNIGSGADGTDEERSGSEGGPAQVLRIS